ncbi:hypothetical protein Cadr_000023163 [Camelus dromedarius]|uniref:Uncharacterized protein n=1 Tax=Camelus dromedarius TaxID=9838 RepID=A0A5N4CHX2_CAMDR|nr:hypothetical protein Cadr_000023163 [Camelus dromedarius]
MKKLNDLLPKGCLSSAAIPSQVHRLWGWWTPSVSRGPTSQA